MYVTGLVDNANPFAKPRKTPGEPTDKNQLLNCVFAEVGSINKYAGNNPGFVGVGVGVEVGVSVCVGVFV